MNATSPSTGQAAAERVVHVPHNSSSSYTCRMYRPKYPELDDLVMVNVRQIAEMGAYVRLKEYGDIEGMILLSELSRRRIRSIQKLIRIGRDEVAVVLRVDKEKGYIDLSKRRVSSEDIVKCEEKYNKSKAVQTIMRNVAENRGIPLMELQETITWPLYEKYGHAFDAFKIALTDSDAVFGSLEVADKTIIEDVLATIRRKMTPAPVKVRAEVELSCFQYEGVAAIKHALAAGESFQTPTSSVKIRLVAPPLYVATASTTEKAGGVTYLEEVLSIVRENITAAGGFFTIKNEARVVSASDDRQLALLMEEYERANAEVSGDDESDVEDAESEDKETADARSSEERNDEFDEIEENNENEQNFDEIDGDAEVSKEES